jgi:hypothetical protein
VIADSNWIGREITFIGGTSKHIYMLDEVELGDKLVKIHGWPLKGNLGRFGRLILFYYLM